MPEKHTKALLVALTVFVCALAAARFIDIARDVFFMSDCVSANAQAAQRAYPLCYLERLKAEQTQVQLVVPQPPQPPLAPLEEKPKARVKE